VASKAALRSQRIHLATYLPIYDHDTRSTLRGKVKRPKYPKTLMIGSEPRFSPKLKQGGGGSIAALCGLGQACGRWPVRKNMGQTMQYRPIFSTCFFNLAIVLEKSPKKFGSLTQTAQTAQSHCNPCIQRCMNDHFL
jgi:hypothetical protein